jgi:hypothetical protein
VPKRIDHDRRAAAASIISRHPRESVAVFIGGSAVVMICANALFMQPGPHPAPILARSSAPAPRVAPLAAPLSPAPILQPARFEPVPATVLPPARPQAAPAAKPKLAAAPEPARQDPIAQLLAPTKRITSVQRILTAYGYGQMKPTGVLDNATEDAIRKFETSRKMPVTGQVSEPLVRALSAMSGQHIE